MKNPTPLSVLCLGGFGHAYAVLDDLMTTRSLVDLRGVVPAYKGEVIGRDFLSHPLLEGIAPGAHPIIPDAPRENAVAIVSTRPDHLAETAAAAARRGWRLIVEKPLATSVGDLEDLHKVVRNQGRRIMTMLTMRSIPAFRRARELVFSGHIGRPGLINLRKSYKWGVRPAWFGEADKYPGTIPWIGIHACDLMTFMTGQRISEVAAYAANAFHTSHPACEDTASLILRGTDGLLGTASIDMLRPDETESHGDDWLRIVGERGSIEGGPAPRTLQITDADGFKDVAVDEPVRYPIFREFLETLNGPRGSDEDLGFHLTEVCLAANQSAKEGTRQQVDAGRWRFTGN